MIYTKIEDLIGNTPLMELSKEKTGLKNIKLYAKLEYMNPFGSLKDRVAKNMLTDIEANIKKEHKTLVEASSGNTGKALALLATTKNIPFLAVSNRMKIEEMRMIMQLSGADIEELPGLSDCPDLSDPNSYTTYAMNLAKKEPEKYHYTDQYFNEKNWQAHYKTGKEILDEVENIDYFFAMLWTTGSSVGVRKALKEKNKNLEMYGVVADSGEHIPWARNSNELWEVGFYDRENYADILSKTTKESILGTKELVQNYGILAGPTAGATYYSSIEKLKEIDATLSEEKTAVFLVCDRVDPYLQFLRKEFGELFSEKISSREKVSDFKNREENDIFITSQELVNNEEKYFIIDIRGNFSYSIWYIKNSINISDEFLTQMIEEGNVFPKDKKILIVCRIGKNSGKYVHFLRKKWYEAYALQWWIKDWKQNNYPLEK